MIKITDESRAAALAMVKAQIPTQGVEGEAETILDLVLEHAVVSRTAISAEEQAQVAEAMQQILEVATGVRAKALPIFGEDVANAMGFQAYSSLVGRPA